MPIITTSDVAEFLRQPEYTGETSPTNTEVSSLISKAENILESRLRINFSKKTTTEIYDVYFFDTITRKYSITVLKQPLLQFDSNNTIEKWVDDKYEPYLPENYFVEPLTNIINFKDRGRYKVTYSYGNTTEITEQIKRLAILLVSIDLLSTGIGIRTSGLSSDKEAVMFNIKEWKNEIDTTIKSIGGFLVI